MAQQTIQTVTRPGIDLTALAVAAAGGGDSWQNSGGQVVAVINGGGSPITVTENYGPNAKFDGTTPTNKTTTVAAGHTELLGPYNPGLFNDNNGNASISYSGVTSVSVCVFQIGTG